MEKIRWERLASILFCLCVGAGLLYLALRYALPLLLPFLFAWLLSLLIRPMSRRISERFHLSQKLCAVILLVLLLGAIVFLLGASVQRLMLELQNLLERLLAENGSVSGAFEHSVDYFDALTSKIGFLRRIGAAERFAAFRERFNETITEMLGSLLESLSAGIPAFAGRVLSALPSFFLVTVVTVISGFYFCVDGERITRAVGACFPAGVRKRLPAWKARLRGFSKGYLRAYLLLLLLTFAELFLGFCILRIDYAFLLALLIAVVDMLPVLGVGTVLIPWAVIALFQRNFYLGFGLLILFFAVTVLRQITEPKLVGQSLGLHPLLTLFASYAGWELFGILGMILGPFAAVIIKSLLAARPCEKS